MASEFCNLCLKARRAPNQTFCAKCKKSRAQSLRAKKQRDQEQIAHENEKLRKQLDDLRRDICYLEKFCPKEDRYWDRIFV